MKQAAFTLSTFFLFTTACTEQEIEKEIQLVDLSQHNLEIIPENPGSNDEI